MQTDGESSRDVIVSFWTLLDKCEKKNILPVHGKIDLLNIDDSCIDVEYGHVVYHSSLFFSSRQPKRSVGLRFTCVLYILIGTKSNFFVFFFFEIFRCCPLQMCCRLVALESCSPQVFPAAALLSMTD
jgi:hypothetical protein